MFLQWLKWTLLFTLTISFILARGDTYAMNPVHKAASPYLYGLIEFEMGNFFNKWLYKMSYYLPWNSTNIDEKQQQIHEYFRLQRFAGQLRRQINGESAGPQDGSAAKIALLEQDLAKVMDTIDSLKKEVEEQLESAISSILSEYGFSSRIGIIFPPVDIKIGQPPKLLVTSPRDSIYRKDSILLQPNMQMDQIESLEYKILRGHDLAALVLNTGGLGSYPAIISDKGNLETTLALAAHEWLHNFLFFHPLGWNMFDNADMITLNETFADIAGDELGTLALQIIDVSRSSDNSRDMSKYDGTSNGTTRDLPFDFMTEMHETRLKVDSFLAKGLIDEAELYMDQRRQLFVENGFFIRKLNQAYFAFHGTYAESPASVSPIADQLNELRNEMTDVGSFINTMATISSYDEFLELLEEIRNMG